MTDPESDSGGELDFSKFLDDFYVECDEHLSVARRSLLSLETQLQQGDVERTLLDELFRSFHSLKGLSAMVGVREAEQVAHRLESYLGVLRKGKTQLNTGGLEALIAGTIAIEQIVAAKRNADNMPGIDGVLQQLDALAPATTVPEEAGTSPQHAVPSPYFSNELNANIAGKLVAGRRAWNIHFVPSSTAAGKGIDVNSIRSQLTELGEIIHAEPRIESAGRIAFHFILVTPTDEIPRLGSNEGVTLSAYEVPVTTASSSAKVDSSVEADSATGRSGASTHLVPANLVRVDLARLDDLMRMVGELVLSRSRLEDVLQRKNVSVPSGVRRTLDEINLAFEHQLRDLREGVMRVRMVPIREVFARMRFVIRDLIREQQKQATLVLSGEETQIDKYIVERMMDPLLHLVRNAVGHGLESPEERIAAGKPAEARIELCAAATGDTIVIEVKDDGRGIDAEAVFARAESTGVLAKRTTDDPHALLDILCRPGFSTREHADRSSGRGVGMDVVRNAVEELGGTLSLQTELGQGTRFIIQLPLTLAITDALIVSVSGQKYAVPQTAVREIIEIERSAILVIEKNELLSYHGGVLPLLRLDRFFQMHAVDDGSSYHVLVVGEGTQAVGLIVRRMLGLREVVVRPLTDRLVQVPGISGATELGDGQVVLIVDVANLLRFAKKRNSSGAVENGILPGLGSPVATLQTGVSL